MAITFDIQSGETRRRKGAQGGRERVASEEEKKKKMIQRWEIDYPILFIFLVGLPDILFKA